MNKEHRTFLLSFKLTSYYFPPCVCPEDVNTITQLELDFSRTLFSRLVLGSHFWLREREGSRDRQGGSQQCPPPTANLVNNKMKTPTGGIVSEIKEVICVLLVSIRHLAR